MKRLALIAAVYAVALPCALAAVAGLALAAVALLVGVGVGEAVRRLDPAEPVTDALACPALNGGE